MKIFWTQVPLLAQHLIDRSDAFQGDVSIYFGEAQFELEVDGKEAIVTFDEATALFIDFKGGGVLKTSVPEAYLTNCQRTVEEVEADFTSVDVYNPKGTRARAVLRDVVLKDGHSPVVDGCILPLPKTVRVPIEFVQHLL